ncbi:MAG: Z1 domain-containing protein [Desulfovibrio sp.]|uniref:Z1 domain-containing protein n=1 Tax=Desulfovibrio sp. TaxID=885 RepID=UPI002A358C00|nr:Z1 domain-containing protein [Desulfovibrio sp.]MDY0260046.1 Z1 domain-containing protein [Desulfovibrio sp.]
MSNSALEKEKQLASSLISLLGDKTPPPTREEVEEKAKILAQLSGFVGDIANVVEQALVAIDSRMGQGVSIVDTETPHDEEWMLKRSISWIYSEAYEKYLRQEGWAPQVVQALSDTGGRILGHLQDPLSEGAWDRRGLVIGHVQSGKTANYMGLVARAADAGYKFIIVIAGIHNNLRKQTQERMDEGFIGRSSDPGNRVIVGVGRFSSDFPHPATLTNINEDFNKNTAEKSGWKLNDFSKPIVLVIKKNVTTLQALHKWLKELNSKNGQITDVPMLMIDDEADNASINTNKPELDPTKTNAWLRQILNLFAKSCYVGYTATPFANIFINPEAYDQDVREELFPKDFIYSLDAPNTYFGPDKVFLEDESSSKILREIRDCEDYLPLTHKKDIPLTELPPSLYKAFNQFIVGKTIRNCRGQNNKHCSMLVNVSRFVAVQRTVKNILALHEKKLREAVKANYAMPEDISSRNKYMQALREAYDSEFIECGVDWDDVKANLLSAFDTLKFFVINSKSDEVLDYKKYEKDGHGLTAVAIGGLSLSRGLTLEGLWMSYMYRNTRMYDTLMQMGRWFGYRPGYEDLCRVYLSPDSIDWYGHIAEKTEELRQQIRKMRRDGLTPRQFGLYVETHPEKLLITAANKMLSAAKIKIRQNLSGRLVESYILPTDNRTNIKNENLIEEFWTNGLAAQIVPTEKGWWAKDVNVAVIEDFLEKFEAHPDMADAKYAATLYLHEISDLHPKGDVVFVSLKDNGEEGSQYKLGAQKRTAKPWEGTAWRTAKNRVASRGDEKLGLTPEQIEKARLLAQEYNEQDQKMSGKPSDVHYREVRNKPLLMVHILEFPDVAYRRVPAFGISFPFGDYSHTVEIAANRVWVQNMQGVLDNPEDEEDFDE